MGAKEDQEAVNRRLDIEFIRGVPFERLVRVALSEGLISGFPSAPEKALSEPSSDHEHMSLPIRGLDCLKPEIQREHCFPKSDKSESTELSVHSFESPVIEVTPEMIEAGRKVISRRWLDFTGPMGEKLWGEVLTQVFQVMLAMRP